MAKQPDTPDSKRRNRRALTLKGPDKAKEPEKPSKQFDGDGIKEAMERAATAYEKERDNIEQAYEDLEFRAGAQWPDKARAERENAKRPILTVNRIPQFVKQVTGDIRLMKPAIKAVPVDSRASEPVAQLLTGMIRYIENRSDSQAAYSTGADSQVTAGIGHWRVTTEYAHETTFNQEIRIMGVDDGVSVLWDPDSKLPTREDAMWCIVPVDMSRERFKQLYPDVPEADFTSYDRRYGSYWCGHDFIRVGEYWEKRPSKRVLALHKDGSIDDLTDADEKQVAEAKAEGARIEKRDAFSVYRSLITIGHYLEEPEEWPGRYIPIIPVIGEEVRIGRKVVRHGIVRFAKDPQRMYNYARSQQTEMVALAPKSPWIGTWKNFQEFEEEWARSNEENLPFLPYTPDGQNGNIPPQRTPPPTVSPGLSELIAISDNDMKAVTGIYDASLGNRSNETSGVAIKARQQEGDVGTVTYVQNFAGSIRHTGRILVDLIPHVYDTERQIQVLGEDGKVDTLWINKTFYDADLADEAEEPIDLDSDDADTGAEVDDTDGTELVDVPHASGRGDEMGQESGQRGDPQGRVYNDVTIGAYGIEIETGPSYTTRREEASAGLQQFIQAAPQVAPLILDLYAKAQDWPLAGEIGKRLEAVLPPPIQMLIAKERAMIGELGPDGKPRPQAEGPQGQQGPPMPMLPPPGAPPPGAAPPEPPPDPAEMASKMADVQTAKAKVDGASLENQRKALDLEIKRIELAMKQAEVAGQAHGHGAAMTQIVQELASLRGMVDELVDQIHGPSAGAAPNGPASPGSSPAVAPIDINAAMPQMDTGA